MYLERQKTGILAHFMPTWHKLESPGKKKTTEEMPPLDRLMPLLDRPTGKQVEHFLDWRLMWADLTHHGECRPLGQ